MAEKAWYWIALGVLVFGLNQAFVSGRLEMPRIADRSASLVDQVSAKAMEYLAMAQFEIGSRSAQFHSVQPAMAHVQANLACVQASIARRQADMALRQVNLVRLQRDQVRSIVLENMRYRRGAIPAPPMPPQMPNDGPI